MRAKVDPLLESIPEAGRLAVVSFERYVGHPFGEGYDSKEIADRLAAVFPDAKVLVVVREQRSMLASAYRNYVRAGGPASVRQFLGRILRFAGCGESGEVIERLPFGVRKNTAEPAPESRCSGAFSAWSGARS